MARSAAGRAEQAAAALDSYLQTRPQAQPDAVGPPGIDAAGQRPRAASPPAAAGPPACFDVPAQTDWLYHRLTISGPAAAMRDLKGRAAGAGMVPWLLDGERMAEDWFHLLAHPSQRSLSLHGARVLAGQLREAVERRHALALARVGQSPACPFDLHTLLPVPDAVLRLGPDHPVALHWLWSHWGTTAALRHVAVAADPPDRDRAAPPIPAGSVALHLTFWAADWTPWRAIERIRADWPALRFDIRPVYDLG